MDGSGRSPEVILFTAGLPVQEEWPTWYYQDLAGVLQGPFDVSAMIKWYQDGALPGDLLVCGISHLDKGARPVGFTGFRPLQTLLAEVQSGRMYIPVRANAATQPMMAASGALQQQQLRQPQQLEQPARMQPALPQAQQLQFMPAPLPQQQQQQQPQPQQQFTIPQQQFAVQQQFQQFRPFAPYPQQPQQPHQPQQQQFPQQPQLQLQQQPQFQQHIQFQQQPQFQQQQPQQFAQQPQQPLLPQQPQQQRGMAGGHGRPMQQQQQQQQQQQPGRMAQQGDLFLPGDQRAAAAAGLKPAASQPPMRAPPVPAMPSQSSPGLMPPPRPGPEPTDLTASGTGANGSSSGGPEPNSPEWGALVNRLLTTGGGDLKWRAIVPSGDRVGPFTVQQMTAWLLQGDPPKSMKTPQKGSGNMRPGQGDLHPNPDELLLCGLLAADYNAQRLPGLKFYKPLTALVALLAGGTNYEPVNKHDITRGYPKAGWNEGRPSAKGRAGTSGMPGGGVPGPGGAAPRAVSSESPQPAGRPGSLRQQGPGSERPSGGSGGRQQRAASASSGGGGGVGGGNSGMQSPSLGGTGVYLGGGKGPGPAPPRMPRGPGQFPEGIEAAAAAFNFGGAAAMAPGGPGPRGGSQQQQQPAAVAAAAAAAMIASLTNSSQQPGGAHMPMGAHSAGMLHAGGFNAQMAQQMGPQRTVSGADGGSVSGSVPGTPAASSIPLVSPLSPIVANGSTAPGARPAAAAALFGAGPQHQQQHQAKARWWIMRGEQLVQGPYTGAAMMQQYMQGSLPDTCLVCCGQPQAPGKAGPVPPQQRAFAQLGALLSGAELGYLPIPAGTAVPPAGAPLLQHPATGAVVRLPQVVPSAGSIPGGPPASQHLQPPQQQQQQQQAPQQKQQQQQRPSYTGSTASSSDVAHAAQPPPPHRGDGGGGGVSGRLPRLSSSGATSAPQGAQQLQQQLQQQQQQHPAFHPPPPSSPAAAVLLGQPGVAAHAVPLAGGVGIGAGGGAFSLTLPPMLAGPLNSTPQLMELVQTVFTSGNLAPPMTPLWYVRHEEAAEPQGPFEPKDALDAVARGRITGSTRVCGVPRAHAAAGGEAPGAAAFQPLGVLVAMLQTQRMAMMGGGPAGIAGMIPVGAQGMPMGAAVPMAAYGVPLAGGIMRPALMPAPGGGFIMAPADAAQMMALSHMGAAGAMHPGLAGMVMGPAGALAMGPAAAMAGMQAPLASVVMGGMQQQQLEGGGSSGGGMQHGSRGHSQRGSSTSGQQQQGEPFSQRSSITGGSSGRRTVDGGASGADGASAPPHRGHHALHSPQMAPSHHAPGEPHGSSREDAVLAAAAASAAAAAALGPQMPLPSAMQAPPPAPQQQAQQHAAAEQAAGLAAAAELDASIGEAHAAATAAVAGMVGSD